MVQRRTTPRRVGVPRAASAAGKARAQAKELAQKQAKATPRRSQRHTAALVSSSTPSEPEVEPELELEPEFDVESDSGNDGIDGAAAGHTDIEDAEEVAFEGDAQHFLAALAREGGKHQTLLHEPFELPFSTSEIGTIEVRSFASAGSGI